MDDVVQDAFIIFDRNIRMNTFQAGMFIKNLFYQHRQMAIA